MAAAPGCPPTANRTPWRRAGRIRKPAVGCDKAFWCIPLPLPISLLVAAYSSARCSAWRASSVGGARTNACRGRIPSSAMSSSPCWPPATCARPRRFAASSTPSSSPVCPSPSTASCSTMASTRSPGAETYKRVAANAGNAIFLAAYLIMAFFFTLERVYSSFAFLLGYKPEDGGFDNNGGNAEAQDMSTAIAGGPISSCSWQALAIYRRNPACPGWGCSSASTCSCCCSSAHCAPRAIACGPGLWVSPGAAGVVALHRSQYPAHVRRAARIMPGLGRLTTLLESDSGSGQVRVLIWQGTAEMVQPHEPLIFPTAAKTRSTPSARSSATARRPLRGLPTTRSIRRRWRKSRR